MTTTMTVSEARAALPLIIGRIRDGDEVVLTRHGEPVAVIVHPSRLRSRRADDALSTAQRIHRVLDEERWRPLDPVRSLSPERADELVRDVRRDRDHR
jgi:prevent-host-death family protein